MLFKSTLLSMTSGSLAGSVFSHNKGGRYMRNRSTPVNPNTSAQTTVRDAFRTLIDAWTNVLTQTQRDGWNLYAFNTPVLNRLGDPVKRTGQNMYVRANTARLQAAVAPVQTAPVIFDLGSFTPIDDIIADQSAQTIDFTFQPADEWAQENGASMLVYQSRPVNPTVDFFKGPWQLVDRVPGNSVTPPTSPFSTTSLFTITTGQKIFLKVRVTRADGRYSEAQIESGIVTA